ncbi:hypothetical protein ASPWEDRAFT_177463 [Aspergillus wentii DTO 134E9]|uniref:Condensation domain-containing protein n=1 Tax=Aspergillus wentii DTO 134E9 TaxID=1073089 RepID=A0A1L9R468_ASPWE|nr:uncharacterized protein ASPWEDRAFT_177463 [Aspergillus wentii DTO 134E9]KAI9927007.1 hypothetical protein MW887_003388 [Aspergillus wentii]OJJ29721.1 hypothetical protein ASPWEDRAFT_177463 [Aspergillus wentii DTO 134E9]
MAAAYPWSQQDGAWRRKLGSMESFYLTLASPEGAPVHWMIGCGVSIAYRGNDSVDIANALRQAWKETRRDFPNITAVVDTNTREMVVGSDESTAVEEWLQKSFQVHDGISADELFSAFKSQFCITLHFLRDTNEVVIQAPHALIDGRGILYLYHALFTTLSRQSEDHSNGINAHTGPLNLTRPYDDWLGVSAIPSEKSVKDAQSIFQRILMQQKPIRLPGVDFGRVPQKTVHRDLALTEETTQSIIESCKQKGVSVTSAWHAALVMATQKIQSSTGEEGTSYTQFTTIDLRRHFPPPFNPHQHSIGSLQTALPLPIDFSTDNTFESISQSLHKQYKNPFVFADNDFGYLGPYMAMSKQILESGGAPPSSTPYLSSMGVVDDFLQPRYGDWELDDFWVSSTMLTGDFQMYLWTWRKRMVFSACYNEAFYGSADVDVVLEKTRDEMITGLGLV